MVGAACAYELAAAGFEVIVVERYAVATGASWAAPGLVGPLVEAMSGKPTAALARVALPTTEALIQRAEADTGLVAGFVRTGALHVAEAAAEEAAFRAWLSTAPPGLELEWLDDAALREAEPHLGAFRGALYCAAESQVYPADYTRVLLAAAVRHGASVHEGRGVLGLTHRAGTVTGVLTAEGVEEGDHMVIAAGAWSGGIALPDGSRLPVRPLRGARLALAPAAPANRHIVYAEHGDLGPKPNGEVWVGATEEDAGFLPGVTATDVADLAQVARTLVPSLAAARFLEARSGYRPTTPDYVPLIGSAAPGLTVATGHWRKGVMFAAITGRLVRQSIAGETPEVDLAPFSPHRFIAS